MFSSLCQFLERHKRYRELSGQLQHCCKYTQQALGLGHPGTAKSLINAALVLHRFEDNYCEAIPLLSEALILYEGVLGADHSDTVMTRIHLGSALRQNNPTEAESLLIDAVSTAEVRNE